ncbi:hypothetical protein [Pedosphaera parvula]|uniref:Uncharacterized protein n=1 Tax=Pedosphaera parvula (strain Ellin514) TaxID=320771 RepID=B9XQW3_PEDPL|nr:hypothetical protein [Pedosphaera parvula]EEF57740.1 conserved hypothetical protein [Pedosphaera parvula Ellin514]
MKKQIAISFAAVTAFAVAVSAEQIRYENKPVPIVPPPVYQVVQTPIAAPTVPAGAREVYVYDQKPLPDQPALLTQEQTQGIIDSFRTNFVKAESPRVLIYVNRELVEESSGMKLSGHSETITTTKNSGATTGTNNVAGETQQSVAKNNYHLSTKPAPTLADRQTIRDVERLFGRPLRAAGVGLVDQHVAAQSIGDKPLSAFTTSSGSEREVLNPIADIAVEVLISSRTVNVPGISGNQNQSVPDIQATAIRLKDSKIIGQASTADLYNRVGLDNAARNFDVNQVTEATALALMEDIANNVK